MRRSGEDQLIGWLRRQPGCGLIGDDAAVLPSHAYAVTTDTQIAGIHVPLDLDPAHTARRLLAVNASDLAAMGAVPAYAFLVLAAPAGFDHRRFLTSLVKACRSSDIALAGGDLARSPRLVTTMTLLGRRHAGSHWLTRDGARPGDRIWLGGTLGESRLGLRALACGVRVMPRGLRLPEPFHSSRPLAQAARRAVWRQIRPTAQLHLGAWLAHQPKVGAAIDLSDGLARDLHRLCRESSVGAEINLQILPASDHAEQLATCVGISLQDAMLYGGEDYILCFTLPDGIEPPDDLGCFPIGQIRRGLRIKIRDLAGRTSILPDHGFDHLTHAPTVSIP